MLLFQFWILIGMFGWINDTGCQWWSSLFWIGQLVGGEIGSLSKTTKLLLLDSLLQEVCIESGSDGSLSLSSLGMSVCLVSHNLLYSGLKKAHSKKIPVGKRKNLCSWMCCPQKFLAREIASCWLEAHWYELEKKIIFWGFMLPPHQRWWLRVTSAPSESRHAGRDGGQGRAADDCSSDVAAGRRRMALLTVTWASLRNVHFLASAISLYPDTFGLGS